MNKPHHQAPDIEFMFGGTFDPVHFGHLAIIEHLRTLSKDIPVRLVPCAIPPLKSKPQTPFDKRVAMLRLATKNFQGISIDEREASRDKASYTVDTLVEMAEEKPGCAVILVMGMDSALTLKQWHQWQKLSEMCHLLILNRPQSNHEIAVQLLADGGFTVLNSLDNLVAYATSHHSGGAVMSEMSEMPQSSTQARDAIKAGAVLDSLLPQSVIEYIGKNYLYKSE